MGFIYLFSVLDFIASWKAFLLQSLIISLSESLWNLCKVKGSLRNYANQMIKSEYNSGEAFGSWDK